MAKGGLDPGNGCDSHGETGFMGVCILDLYADTAQYIDETQLLHTSKCTHI